MSERSNVFPFPLAGDEEAKERLIPFSERVVTVSTLEGQPTRPIEYLVPGLIASSNVTLLAGPREAGKSFLCQMLMTACALGKEWMGLEVAACRSLGVFSEDETERLKERQRAVNDLYGCELVDLEDRITWMPEDFKFPDQEPLLFKASNNFSTRAKPTRLWEQVSNHCRSQECGALILDNAGSLCSISANNPHHVKSVIRYLQSEAKDIGLAIILIVHPPAAYASDTAQTKYFSGSQQWENSVRQALTLDAPITEPGQKPTPGELVLRVRKANYLPHNDPLRTDGLPLKWEGGLIVPRLEGRRGPLGQMEKLDLDDRVLRAIRYIVESEGGKVARDPRSPNSLPARAVTSPKWQGFKRPELEASVERLIEAAKLVKVAVDGTWLVRPRVEGDPPHQPQDCRYLGEA